MSEPVWTGYVFAMAASAAAVVLEWGFQPVLGNRLSLHLLGFAAVVTSATMAGQGPGTLATVIVTACYGWFAQLHAPLPLPEATARVCFFLAENAVICALGSALHNSTYRIAKSEDWHRRLVDTSGEGIWVTDPEGAVTYANQKMADILGCSVDETIGRHREEFFFPGDLVLERIRYKSFLHGNREQVDRRVKRRDGSEVWLLACSSPIFDDRNELQSVLAMMTDITERKRAESALRRSEQKYRELFENILEGVYQSTPDGRIIAANPMLLQMLGLANEAELNDVNIAHHLYVDPDVRRNLLERLNRDGSIQNIEYQLRRRDKQVITVRENARVVRDEDGKVLYYEGTLTDITEPVRVEEQLRQAQKMEALGRLAFGVAQDFRHIVATISGHTQALLRNIPSDDFNRLHAEGAAQATGSASALTQQLLAFSRRHGSAPAVIDLNRVILAHKQSIRKVLGGSLELSLELQRGDVCVVADEEHVAQIVSGLVARIRDNIAPGGVVEIETGTRQVSDETAEELHGVEPADYAALIISAGDASTVGAREGAESGLQGMSTTQAMLALYGGFVAARSKPGRGLAFEVLIPLAPADSTAAEPEDVSVEATVLFIESDPLVRELSRDMLERQGFCVLTAAGAADAVRIASAEEAVDVLVTNAELDGSTSGIDLAQTIRQKWPDLRVLLLSNEFNVDLKQFHAEVMQKPFSADALAQKIQSMLGQAAAESA